MATRPAREPAVAGRAPAAALSHRGLGRRRQEHADRPAPPRQPRDPRRPARRARGARPAAASRSTSPCSPTASRPSASRASRSTSPTATSRRRERKFIIADAPGHEQYTRNMVTAAAGSDAAVVLVDATKLDLARRDSRSQLLPQTRRHALLAQLLRVPHIVFAVNKLDAVADPARGVRARARRAGRLRRRGRLRAGRHRADLGAARRQRQPAERARRLRRTDAARAARAAAERRAPATATTLVPVQYVGAQAGNGVGHRPRVLWGRVARGEVAVGAELVVFPSGETARVAELHAAGGRVAGVGADRSVGVVLDRQLDVSRGDWLGDAGQRSRRRRAFAPRSPGSTASRRSSAASTGCATATAGCRDASPRSRAGSTSRRSPRTPPTRSPSTTSARSSSRRSSRCRSSASPTIASPARCSSSIRRRTGPAARCSSANRSLA